MRHNKKEEMMVELRPPAWIFKKSVTPVEVWLDGYNRGSQKKEVLSDE